MNKPIHVNSSTGTAIESYLEWIRSELSRKQYGEVTISFVVVKGQVTGVKKISMDSEHTHLE